MTIELAPEVEQALSNRARIEGATMDEVIKRLLETTSPIPKLVPPQLPLTPENDSMVRLLQSHLDAGANATPGEIAEDEAEWEDFRRALHENSFAFGDLPPHEDEPA